MVKDMSSLSPRASGGIISLQGGGKTGNGVGNGIKKPRKTNWDLLHSRPEVPSSMQDIPLWMRDAPWFDELDLPPPDPVEFPLSSSRNPITASDEQILRALERMASDIHHADQVPPSLRSRIGKLGGKAIHGIGRGIKALFTGPAVFEALMTDMAMFPEELGEGEKDLYFNPDLEYIRRKRREERDRAFKDDYTQRTGRPWSDKWWVRNPNIAKFLEQQSFRMRQPIASGGSVMPGTYGSAGNRPMNGPGQQFDRPGQGLQQPQPAYGQPPAIGGLQPMAGPQLLPPAGGFQAPPQIGGPQVPPLPLNPPLASGGVVPGYGIGGFLKRLGKGATFGAAQLLPENIRDPINKVTLRAAPVAANLIPGVGPVASAGIGALAKGIEGKIDSDRARDAMPPNGRHSEQSPIMDREGRFWDMGAGGVVGYQEGGTLGEPDHSLAGRLRDLLRAMTSPSPLPLDGIASLGGAAKAGLKNIWGYLKESTRREIERLERETPPGMPFELDNPEYWYPEGRNPERNGADTTIGLPRAASGGIIGLQAGGTPPAGGGAEYQTPAADTGPGYGATELPENYGQPEQYEGYGAPAEMQVRQEFVSPEVAGEYADIKQGIMDVGTKPYEQFQGPRLAGFTGMEAAAQAGAGAYGTGPGPQGTMQAASTLGQAGRGIGQVASAAGTPGQQKDAKALDPYMSQYMEGAIAPQIRSIEAQGRKARSETGSRAAQAQAFGGYRHGLEEQAVGQATRQQIADVQATGQQQAFESAQQAYERDRTARAAGRQQQLGAYGQMRYLGGQEAALGQQQQSQQYERLRQMQAAGASQRQLQQAGLDVAQQEFERQKAYPQQQLSWMSGQLGALPYQNIVQQGVYGQQPGFWSGAAGKLAGGAGAAASYEERQLDIDKKRREEEEAAANGGG